MNLDHLKAEFPRARVHWRAQTVRNGRALAVAYIDARDVMGRLDEVCGPHNWQDEYVIHGDRTICRLGIKIGDEWVWKSDGAGETQVEAEKGAISDAFKRAAVKWGIGRYLYSIEATWVPCESRTDPKNANRQIFIKFNVNPWELIGIKEEPVVGKLGKKALQDKIREFDDELHSIEDSGQLAGLEEAYKEALAQCERDLPSWYYGKAGSDSLGIKDRIAAKRKELEAAEREGPQEPRGLPQKVITILRPEGGGREFPATNRGALEALSDLEAQCAINPDAWQANREMILHMAQMTKSDEVKKRALALEKEMEQPVLMP